MRRTVCTVAERGPTIIVENRLEIAAMAVFETPELAHGRPLEVTMSCVTDEICGAAAPIKLKASGVSVAVVSGFGRFVGALNLPGARDIVRPPEMDLFRQGP